MVGAIDGAGAAALYAVGWGRAFSHDASRTVANLVAARSLGDVLRQDRFNNHPLFSVLEYVVHGVTRSVDERTLRALPIGCAVLAIALVAAAVARRLGPIAGHVAGATLALNPLAARQFREVRGYALVTLAAVVATLALFEGMDRPRPRSTGVYVVAMAVALCTHLFAAGLLVLHAVVVLARKPRLIRRWILPWAAILMLALPLQWQAMVDGIRHPVPRAFDPTFPVRLVVNLLGQAALPGMLVLVASGALVLRARPWVPWAVVTAAAMPLAWWVIGPAFLDSRFFVWLVPATAVAVGVAVGHRPRLAYLALAVAIVELATFVINQPTRSEEPNRIAAAFAEEVQHHGASACGIGRTSVGLRAYVDLPAVWDPALLRDCDVAVDATGPENQPLLEGAACERFNVLLILPAKTPGAVFADKPLPLVPELASEAKGTARWESTRSARFCERSRRPAAARTALAPSPAKSNGRASPR